ncbi:Coiled-coil-helix-coiled-coil-helix domain-containing protein 7 [Bulinus truncatus]|nr:Coiled-coil-helix-coiled-coil-helix domain-containing protein 7 [Bulinus truncatus]
MPEAENKINIDDNKTRSANAAAERAKNDPCLRENEMSMQCLNENAYDGSKCQDFFKNYRNCRKFWAWIVKQRKEQGVIPHLPELEDREKVKEEFLPKLLNKST